MARSTTLDMTAGAGRKRRRHRILVFALVVVAVLAVLAIGAVAWLRQALPRIAAAEIGRLMNAHVETGAFDLGLNGSVSVGGLTIRPAREEPPYDNTILIAENVYAKLSRRSLLSLSPQVTDISVEGFILDVQLNLNTGRWNIGTLRFNTPGGGGGALPGISLKGGKLRYCRISGIEREVVMSIPIEAHFGPDPEGNPGYSFEVKTAKLSGGYGESHLSGRWRPVYGPLLPGELTLAGGLSSTDIPSLERAWAIDVLAGAIQYDRSGKYSLELRLNDLHGKHAPEVNMLPFLTPASVQGAGPLASLQKFFAEYQPTGTVGSITIKADGNLKRWQESEIEGKLVCKDISVCDSEFPYRLDHLTGELEFTQSTMRANQLVGKHGPVEVHIDGWTKGAGGDRQYQYRVTSRNMVLDKALYTALDPDQKRLWDAFQPTGTVSVDYRQARMSPTNKRLFLAVDLNDVTAAFQGFPYPLTGLTGNLFFDRESIAISDVVSKTGGRQIRVNGKVTEHSAGKPVYYITVDAKNIPLDATLRDALPVRHRDLFSRFDVNGLADIRARIFSASDANGLAQARPGVSVLGSLPPNAASTVLPLSARPGTAPATGLGVAPTAPGLLGVPISSPRAAAADPNREVARLVSRSQASATRAVAGPNNIGPTGPEAARRVTFLADVSCRKGSLKLTQSYPESPRRETAEPAGPATASVESKSPAGSGRPLVLSDITAEATITPESLSIRKLTGRHGRSPVSITGGARFGPDGRLKQSHMKITAQQVPLDEATLSLLPPSIMHQAVAFHPEGDINVVVEAQKADSNEPAGYEVVVDCLGDKINHERFAYPLQDIRGTISFTKNRVALKDIAAKPLDAAQTTEDRGQRTESENAKYEVRNSKSESVLRIDGSATVARGTLDQGSFTVKATDMLFTEALGRALPKTWAGLYRELALQGPFDLDLTALKVSRTAADEALVEFGGKVSLKTCNLKASGTAMEVSGALEAAGSYSTKHGLSRGRAQLAADRFVVKGRAATRASLEAIYDPNARRWTAENFVGDCYGGKLLGRLEVGMPEDRGQKAEGGGQKTEDGKRLSPGLEYQLQVALDDVDLQQFLIAGRKAEEGEQQTGDRGPSSVPGPPSSGLPSASSGTMDASLSLCARLGEPAGGESRSGTSGAGSSRRGACRIDIANMQVGKVSPVRNVLSVLRLSEPADYTFERMSIDSYIRADKLLIPKLDLSGKSAAFTGSGTMDLPTEEVNLTLTARGQRVSAAEPSVLQSLTEGLGGAVVRMEVTGKASNPHVQTKTLPLLEDSLRILGTPEENKKKK